MQVRYDARKAQSAIYPDELYNGASPPRGMAEKHKNYIEYQ